MTAVSRQLGRVLCSILCAVCCTGVQQGCEQHRSEWLGISVSIASALLLKQSKAALFCWTIRTWCAGLCLQGFPTLSKSQVQIPVQCFSGVLVSLEQSFQLQLPACSTLHMASTTDTDACGCRCCHSLSSFSSCNSPQISLKLPCIKHLHMNTTQLQVRSGRGAVCPTCTIFNTDHHPTHVLLTLAGPLL